MTDHRACRVGEVVWVETELEVQGLPGVLERRGNFLYLRAHAELGVAADGQPVDGLQVVATSPDAATLLTADDRAFRGISDGELRGVTRLR